MSFVQFALHRALLTAIAEEGYSSPTPIQTQAIPLIMEGKDLFGLAQTGTGKTAAFALPILHYYLHNRPQRFPARRGPRCLVLTPTRELAMQVAESFTTYGKHTHLKVAVAYGGVSILPQKQALLRNPEILVATPGRLLDILEQGFTDLSSIDVFVLDEADRMFDMGFIRDIRRVVALLPTERQTLLFSATMPNEIAKLAQGILRSPSRVEVTPAYRAADTVVQSVYFVASRERVPLLKHLLKSQRIKRAIVFTRTKHIANRVAESLAKEQIIAAAFHSNKSQSARVRTLAEFKSGDIRVLVATDIAARGLDVDDVEVVVNYDLPEVPETYVHRIGRAGRAGKTGSAWTLCIAEQRPLLSEIERVTKVQPQLVDSHCRLDEEAQLLLNEHQAERSQPNKKSARPTVYKPPSNKPSHNQPKRAKQPSPSQRSKQPKKSIQTRKSR